MSALVWAGINQIGIAAQTVIDAAPFYQGALLGGVLAVETGQMFLNRQRI